MKAKIKFANDLGLGGLLIWSVSTPSSSSLACTSRRRPVKYAPC